MIELLASTGIRVGELVNLNIDDVLFNERECVVLGKGDSERTVYFDAKTKIHLLKYLESRIDEALSITLVMNASEVSLHPVFGFERKSCPSSFKNS